MERILVQSDDSEDKLDEEQEYLDSYFERIDEFRSRMEMLEEQELSIMEESSPREAVQNWLASLRCWVEAYQSAITTIEHDHSDPGDVSSFSESLAVGHIELTDLNKTIATPDGWWWNSRSALHFGMSVSRRYHM